MTPTLAGRSLNEHPKALVNAMGLALSGRHNECNSRHKVATAERYLVRLAYKRRRAPSAKEGVNTWSALLFSAPWAALMVAAMSAYWRLLAKVAVCVCAGNSKV
jgi:hypothetical protein